MDEAGRTTGSAPARPLGALDLLARRLLVVLAALALLGSGAGDLLPRPDGSAVVAAASTSSGGASDEGSSMHAPASAVLVRGVALALAPGPTAPGAALAPGSRPLVAPHLAAAPQSRPPTALLPAAVLGAPGSRAPPLLAGT